MTTSHIAIAPNLYLVEQVLDLQPAEPAAPTPTDHVLMVDCSGSMAADLPQIREQLKRRLPSILKDGDSFTLVWFSGRGQYGTLIDHENIVGLPELKDVFDRIDRWLRPIGLTGFKEPLMGLLNGPIKPTNPIALVFMSDGQDNQWSRAEIMGVIDRIRPRVASATFVEYGYYADRAMLAAMAQAAGGVHVFAEDFDQYAPLFERIIQQPVQAAPKRRVRIGAPPVERFAFAFAAPDLVTYEVFRCNHATVAADTKVLYYLSHARPAFSKEIQPIPPGRQPELLFGAGYSAAYAAMALFAARMQPDIVLALLRYTGDVRLIKQFSTCFGKQAYTAFMATTKAAAFDPNERLLGGYDPDSVPREDALTIFHLLELLQSDPATRVLLDHPAFKYSRISRRRVDADENLTIEEQARVDELRERLGTTRIAGKVLEIQAEINAILAKKRDALKFVADPTPDGYPFEALKFNENSPNISILVRKTGTVDLTSRAASMPAGVQQALEAAGKWAIPTFDTHIWRNYAIVAHGLVNVERLPVKISRELELRLAGNGVAMEHAEGAVTIIDLRHIPILNRAMMRRVRMVDAVNLEYQLTWSRAFQKVYKHVVDGLTPGEKQATFIDKYGEAGAAWLKEQGLTENGFAPRMTVAESTDYITGRELEIKLAGYSKLPKVDDVHAKLAMIAAAKKVKLNGPETIMAEAIRDIEQSSEAFGADTSKTVDDFKAHLIEQQKAIIAETRALILHAARMKFAITVGQAWFAEFKTLDENRLDVEIPGVGKISAVADLRETQIKI